MRIWFFAACSVALTLGCQSSSDTSGSGTTATDTTTSGDTTTSSDTTTGPAGCSRDVLESDGFKAGPMSGPAVDPATGELANLPSTFVVSTTYLTLKQDQATKDLFFKALGPVQAQMKGATGLLAVQLQMSNECATARTLSVWKDEGAMFEFATGSAHQDAANQIDTISRGQSVVLHWDGTTASDATWETAAKKLGEEDGPFY